MPRFMVPRSCDSPPLPLSLSRDPRHQYRFAAIALTIVMLPVRAQTPWITGIHRFVEVSVGIAVGLLFAILWPREESQTT